VTNEPPRTGALSLPDNPDLSWLRKQAKRLLKELRITAPEAKLADAQFELATRHGFSSWRALKAHVDSANAEPLLTAALAHAERAEPAIKSAALLYIARVLNVFDHVAAERLLERGIEAAHALREPVRSVILGRAIALAATVSPAQAVRLARSIGDGDPGAVVTEAVFNMLRHGHKVAAIEYLLSDQALERFPFDAALSTIGQAGDDATRLQLLRAAIRANQVQAVLGRDRAGSRPERFSFLFTRWWRLLDPDEASAVVQEMVQAILGQPDGFIHATWNDVAFSSIHEHRLFEIFSPLRHLRPELAESLLGTRSQLASAIARYPYGPESFAAPAESRERPPADMEEQPRYIVVGAQLMPIPEALRTDFKESFVRALQLYTTDTDATRPNDAPQECWPSAFEFRNILYKAGEHEGRTAVRLLDRIPDLNLRLLAQIELAAALVGLPQMGGSTIVPGPAGLRGAGEHRSATLHSERRPPYVPSPPPPPAKKPNLPPSDKVRIAVSRRTADDGPSGGSGPDYWVIEGARLRPVLAKLFETVETRIELSPGADRGRHDFVLVLPRPTTREAMGRAMRAGVERYFGVTIEIRSVEAYVLTAPNGIRARVAIDDRAGLGFGSVGFTEMASAEDMSRMASEFALRQIMDLWAVPSERPRDDGADAVGRELRNDLAGSLGRHAHVHSLRQSSTVADLCRLLEGGLDRPLLDETGLTEVYAIDIHAEPMTTRAFLDVLCDKLHLTLATATREVSVLRCRS
jgi:hypothetical protein